MLYRFNKWRKTRVEDLRLERSVREREQARGKLGEIAATHFVLHTEAGLMEPAESFENVVDIMPRLDPRTSELAAQACLEGVKKQISHVKILHKNPDLGIAPETEVN